MPLVLEFRMIKSFQMADTKNSAEKMKEIRKNLQKKQPRIKEGRFLKPVVFALRRAGFQKSVFLRNAVLIT